MYNKLLLLLFLLILPNTYSQNNFLNEINKIDRVVKISDSLFTNYICTARKFINLSRFDILIEDHNFKFDSTFFKWAYLGDTYFVFYDLDTTPFLFITYDFNELGNCELIHKYYFNAKGKTILYDYSCSRFDTTSFKIYSKQRTTYFNEDSDSIKVIEKYNSDELKNMNDSNRFEVIDQYDFNLIYKLDLGSILVLYNIQL